MVVYLFTIKSVGVSQALSYVYQALLGESDLEPLREMNFTTIRSMNNTALMTRIERDFDRYLRDILLELQENSKEDASAILAVIRHETLDQDALRAFLERQTTLLPAIEDVPEKLQALLFKLSVIEPTWVNCLAFMEGDGFEVESLVGYLDRDIVRATILEHAIPSDPDSLPLRQLLFGAGSLSDDAYREYAHALPKAFKKLPEGLEPTKLQILIDERKITFTKESLDALVDNRDLQILFVAANIDTYLANPDSYALDDDFREGLLRSKIENAVKLRIVKLMDLNAIVNLPSRATLIGPIIQNTDVEIFDLNVDIIRSLIEHSRPIETQISLLNKYHAHLNDDEVRQFLTSLPQPFSEINTGYQVPRLENTPENQDLVRWLDSREIISSWSNSGLFTNDIRVNLYRR